MPQPSKFDLTNVPIGKTALPEMGVTNISFVHSAV
jgi:hypothetical protein